jgi:hypothetical protein
LTDFLTTDELLDVINNQSSSKNEYKVKSNKYENQSLDSIQKKLKKNKIIYLSIAILILMHIIYLILPLVLPDNGLGLYGMSNVLAVPIDQDVVIDEGSFEVFAAVVVVEKFDPSKLDIGDLIVIYGKYGSDVYWVERVVDYNLEEGTVTTSLDGVFASDDVTSLDQVRGYFVRMAGTSGALQYVSSNFRGFTLIVLIELTVLYGLYFLIIDPVKKKEKHLFNTQNQENNDHIKETKANEINKP